MNLLRCSLLLFAVGSFAGTAQGSLITYDLVGASTSAGRLAGTLTIDSTTGLVRSANLTFEDASLDTPVFTRVGSTAAYNGLGQDWISGGSSGAQNYGGQAALYFDTANLSSGGTLQLCTAGMICGIQGVETSFVQVYSTRGNVIFDLSSGELSQDRPQLALTPEPSGLILTGTGVLGLAGLCGVRRLRRRNTLQEPISAKSGERSAYNLPRIAEKWSDPGVAWQLSSR